MKNNDPFWSKEKHQLYAELDCSESGLTQEEAGRRIQRFGSNAIGHKRSAGIPGLLLNQFRSPITILLISAAILSFILKDTTDAVIILVIILISSLLGFWQEKGASNAVAELLKLVQIKCSVIRNGIATDIPVEQVVPGDIVELNAGDIVPADALLIESKNLFVDEAAFTGETFPVEKKPGISDADAGIAKRSNAVFMGSHVVSGTAKVLVTTTGPGTAFGEISGKLQEGNIETDFEKGIRHFGYLLMQVTLLLVVIIFAVNVLLHKPALDSILFSLALAVGLTPQLLPAIISINLSTGARRMAVEKVIVKRLSSIENLGSMNILCTDKTGTITEGKVKVNAALDTEGLPDEEVMRYAWMNASLQRGFGNPIDEAIKLAYASAAIPELLDEVPYDFSRKRLSVLTGSEKGRIAISKGAFDQILQICTTARHNDAIVPLSSCQQDLRERYEAMSAEGLRVLALAYRNWDADTFRVADEKEMTFMGFITLFDPPKQGVKQTIAELDKLGVKLKMITGDNKGVARSLGLQVGMTSPRVLSGSELRQMNTPALVQKAAETDIFAEVEPSQKEQIIMALKKGGHVVGFMGDGINDAPALHAADVGISVDTAVDVAKEAADIVLLSQSLNVLGTGIRSGRITFANTMKYIFMATSANFGNMFSMAGASLFLPFLPLLPKQILLTNVMTDIPEMTIASDKVDVDQVEHPQQWDLRFIKRFMITFGLISSVFDYLTFGVLLWLLHAGQAHFQTGWFTESVISASMIVLVVRTRKSFMASRPGRQLTLATVAIVLLTLVLPWLPFANVLGFSPMPMHFYGWLLLIILGYIMTAETAKHWFYKYMKKNMR